MCSNRSEVVDEEENCSRAKCSQKIYRSNGTRLNLEWGPHATPERPTSWKLALGGVLDATLSSQMVSLVCQVDHLASPYFAPTWIESHPPCVQHPLQKHSGSLKRGFKPSKWASPGERKSSPQRHLQAVHSVIELYLTKPLSLGSSPSSSSSLPFSSPKHGDTGKP